jgi:hypothetical protein
MAENDHGTYAEISTEKELMKLTTTSKYVVVHFFHKDFRRCDIMDNHLKVLCSGRARGMAGQEHALICFVDW